MWRLTGFPKDAAKPLVDLQESEEMISLTEAVAKYRGEYGALEVVDVETNTIIKAWCVDWERCQSGTTPEK